MFDADSNEINVGDILEVADGSEETRIYTVNKYGHIVSLPFQVCDSRKPRCFRITRKWCDNGEPVTLPPAEEKAPEVEAAPAAPYEPNISEVPDLELKMELERRGWTVKATKEIMVPQTIEL